MLSSNVIFAIEVLLRLDRVDPNTATAAYVHVSGTDLSELLSANKMLKSSYLAVLRRLMQNGYIASTSRRNCFVALCDPNQITVLQLVKLFHGDICIGEQYAHRLTFGCGRPSTAAGCNLLAFENRLYNVLYKIFLHMPITTFREGVPAINACGE